MKLISDGRFYTVPDKYIKNKSYFPNYNKKSNSSVTRVEDSLISEIILQRDNPDTEFQFVKNKRRVDCPIEPSILKRLKDYQVKDVQFMLSHARCLNRNPMGLGKTIETIALMKSLDCKNALIIAPKSTLFQWKKQIEEWWPEATDRVEVLPDTLKGNGIYLFNYDILSRRENTVAALRRFHWEVMVCDEAHRIKNPKSKRTEAIKSIPATRKIALTGTPIMSRPDDLWSILNWLDDKYSGRSYWHFVDYFCSIKKDFWGQCIDGLTKDATKVEVLRELLSRVSVYNTVNVASGKTSEIVPLKMQPKQKNLFKKTKQLVLNELPETVSVANGAVLCMRLQQISSWPGLFNDEKHRFGDGAKFEWVQDFLDDNPNEKVVVYTKFATTARALSDYLKQRCVVYTGGMSAKEREESKRSFINDSEIRVLIGTIGSLGEGVDGLQYASRTAVFLDRDWLPSVLEQCEDRLNRMGQKYPVVCYYLECEKSFDQYVGRIDQKKSDDIRRALLNG